MPRPQTVAVIGAGHYHAAYYPVYLDLLAEQRLAIVGVHDPDPAIAEDRARRVESRPYTDYKAMIEQTRPDFVVALGRHVDMPPVFRYLVEAGVPFLMEKPWGTDAATVNELAALAEAKGAWAAVPFSMRYSFWAESAREMLRRNQLGKASHILFRMVRPGVQRYIDQGCSWMLNKAEAGGGVLLNLGIHGFDLCRWLTGEEPELISAVTSHVVHSREVEDYAFATLRTPSGIIFHTEVGYTFPGDGSDDEQKLAAMRGVLRETASGYQLIKASGRTNIQAPPDYVGTWKRVILECLGNLARGEGPPATANDCARAVSLVFEAYAMAGEK